MQTNYTTKNGDLPKIAPQVFPKDRPFYPKEFIVSLAETAGQTMHDWLVANQAPKEVVDLVGASQFLTRMEGSDFENLSPMDNRELESEIPVIIREIAMLGGVFRGPYTCSFPREDVIKWERGGTPCPLCGAPALPDPDRPGCLICDRCDEPVAFNSVGES